MAELSALVRAARGLEPPEPPPTLWRAVEGVAASARERCRPGSAWRPFAVGALAGAAALALALFALPAARGRFAASRAPRPQAVAPRRPSSDPLLDEAEAEFARAAAAYERSIEKLRDAARPGGDGLEPGRARPHRRAPRPARRRHRALARGRPPDARRQRRQRAAVRGLPAEDRVSRGGRPSRAASGATRTP